MRRRVFYFVMPAIAIFLSHIANAQSDAATQVVKVHLEPTINITAKTATDVNMGFRDIAHYMNGVESGAQQFQVNSNRDFVVNVKTDAPSFSYSGNESPAPSMPVDNTLFLEVTDNQTGGNVGNSFGNYRSLSNIPKDLLLNCKNGANQTFSVSYKASPGTNYPAGDYTVGVIYTATQP